MPAPEPNDTLPNSTAVNADAGEPNPAVAPPKDGEGPPLSGGAPQGGAVIPPGLAEARAEAAANFDRFMRAAADLENFRRRTVREKDELQSMVTGRVLEDIFPVLDNLALALTAAKQPGADVKSLVGGVEIVLAQLKAALGRHGLKEINPFGAPFDPHQHEAISHEPSAEVKEEHVLTIVRTGYSLPGRLLRPASVIVSSGPDKKESG